MYNFAYLSRFLLLLGLFRWELVTTWHAFLAGDRDMTLKTSIVYSKTFKMQT